MLLKHSKSTVYRALPTEYRAVRSLAKRTVRMKKRVFGTNYFNGKPPIRRLEYFSETLYDKIHRIHFNKHRYRKTRGQNNEKAIPPSNRFLFSCFIVR